MSKPDKNIELRSDEIQEILGKIPPWLIRRGMMGISLVLILMLVMAGFFNYPDRITSQIKLTTDHPPVYLIARTSAKINKFFVEENQEVNAGDLLVVLESPADYLDVLSARELISTLPSGPHDMDTNLLVSVYNLNDLELGTLQGEFASLQKTIQELIEFLRFDKYQVRVQGKEKEYRDNVIYYNRLYEQKINKEKELEIVENQYNRNIALHEDATISDLALETSEKQYLNQKSELDKARIEMASKSLDMGRLEQSIEELKIAQKEEELGDYGQILESKNKFLDVAFLKTLLVIVQSSAL